MPRTSPRSRLLAAALAVATAAALTLTGGTAASASGSASYPGAKPTWARAANEQAKPKAKKMVEGELVFALRDRLGAEKLARDVSTPGTALYGEYVTPSEWITRFSPRKAGFDSALHYLRRNHLTITGTPTSRLFITFRGTVDQLEDLFSTRLAEYVHGGQTVIAPATAPSLPAGLSHVVSGMYLGTARLATRPMTASAPTAAGAQVSLPGYRCSTYWKQHSFTLPEAYGRTRFPTANCGYVGKQLRSVYGASKSMTGQGQTVATLLWYGTSTAVRDSATFAKRHGGTPLTSATYRQIVAKKFYDVKACGGIGGAQIEQVIDSTAIHAVAPKAKVLYVGAFSCGTGMDVSLSQILDHRLARIVSNSWGYLGELPADVARMNENQHLQAVAEGIGMYFSSGDAGDESVNLGTASVDYPASSPWVTAVGGTTTEIARTGRAAVQTGWGNHYDAVRKDPATGALSYQADPPGAFERGSGGGESAVYARPWYQDGTVQTSGRAVPDVAAIGDPRTGARIGYRLHDDETGGVLPYEEATYGGTSLSSPLFAAEVALVQQKTHRVFGFIAPLVYAAAQAGAPALQDVRSIDVAVAYNDQFDGHTSLVTGNLDSSLTTGPGWDDVTGLGVLRLDRIGKSMR